ncbi:MAG: sporulation protein YqfD [Ruthenibacterium sp.]
MTRLLGALMGRVTFEVQGGRGERFLNACVQNGVPVQHILATELGFTAEVPLRYYLRLHRLARAQRCRMRVQRKQGVYFALRAYRGRWGILAGLILAAVLLTVCPRMIWTVQFYDFTPQEQTLLRKQLYDCGVCEGSMPSTEELISLQQSLFLQNTVYSWVKLNFVNGKLVAEKVDAVPPPAFESVTPASIVALCDGIIERMEVDGGFIERKEGQSVAKGDVIVSAVGVGRTGKLYTQRANARVYASVERTYETIQPRSATLNVLQTQAADVYAIYAFGHQFSLPFQPQPPHGAKGTVLRSPVTFFGVPLPATVVRTQYRAEQKAVVTRTETLAADLARDRIYSAILSDLPECELRSSEETIETTNDAVRLRLKITARANIARVVESGGL